MRHNTEMTKSGRKSKIAYGIGDALNKNHSYEIKKGGIGNEIIGRDKDGNKTMHIRVVADASPSHGPGTGVRKGFHVWDMMTAKISGSTRKIWVVRSNSSTITTYRFSKYFSCS
jgi:hypothetical protein